MANQPGHTIATIAVDVADEITAGTRVTYQNIGPNDVLIFEGSEANRIAGTHNPNVLRGSPFYDSITFTISSDPIWAYTKDSDSTSALSVVY